MKTITASPDIVLSLGRQGENAVRQIIFDITDWHSEFGEDGVVTLLAQRPGDAEPYPVAATVSGASVTWLVSAADTAKPGVYGQAELQYRIGDVVVKSAIWRTFIADSLGTPSPTPPEPQQAWVDQVLSAGKQAADFANDAEGSAKAAQAFGETAKRAAETAESASASASDAAAKAESSSGNAEQAAKDAQASAAQAEQAARVPTIDLISIPVPVIVQPGVTVSYDVGADMISVLTSAANSGRAKLTVGIQIPGTQTVVPAMVFAGAGQIQIPGSVQYQFSGSFGYNYILFGAILDWSQNGTSLTVTCKPNWAT